MRRLATIVVAACALAACTSRRTPAPAANTAPDAAAPRQRAGRVDEVIDLTEVFREGAIDTAGPVVDLGERQAAPYLVSAAALPTETVNGDSWVSVGTRLRLRVPLGEVAPGAGPSAVRLRVRRASARGLALMVDGVLVRAAPLPQDGAPAIINLPVPPDRFTRATAEVELRFGAPRPVPGVLSPVAAQVDWVHLARRDVSPARVADLVNDVAAERTPRRALTFYAPTRLSAMMILPTGSTWTASIAAEGPRGARPVDAVTAVLRAETDGSDAIEERVDIRPNRAWHDAALDLSQFGGRPVRLSIAAEGAEEARLAVAAPSLRRRAARAAPAPGAEPAAPRASVRHVVMVVVRGLRVDRIVPTLSPHLAAGGFARLVADGTVAVAQAPAPREFSALVSTTTGLPADLHHVSELTDALDDEAPTLISTLAAAGVATSAYTDDVAWVGSGADRGLRDRHPCAADAATCKPDWMFTAAADELIAQGESPSFTMIITRAGLLPLDPAPEDVTALDPRPYEGTMTPSRTAVYGLRPRAESAAMTAVDQERLGLLYDASLLAVDRGLGQLFERLHDHNLDGDTAVIVVGDRGVALGENRAVGDGPMTLASVAETVFLARGPGFPAARVEGVAGSIDAAATALERLGVTAPAELEGVSLAGAAVSHDRVLGFVATPRWDVGLRFGDLVALPRAARDGGGIGLYARDGDALSQSDLAAVRPIARELGEAAMAAFRPGAGRRLFPPSTRVLPAPLEAQMRFRR